MCISCTHTNSVTYSATSVKHIYIYFSDGRSLSSLTAAAFRLVFFNIYSIFMLFVLAYFQITFSTSAPLLLHAITFCCYGLHISIKKLFSAHYLC